MFRRHPAAVTAEPPGHPGQEGLGALTDPSVPTRACCCPARPMYKVVLPPTAARPHPVDLWLCGHHCYASRDGLAAAGADVQRVDRLAAPADQPVPASV
ncbi:MAG TPA: hypothetical protein VMH35_20565 [Streptosporangiaceae bacterium]|nr:hypothetical protein [Streptosporangiaceae bacterium]